MPARPTDDPVAHREGWVRIAVKAFEAELQSLEARGEFMRDALLLEATTAGKLAATVVSAVYGTAEPDV